MYVTTGRDFDERRNTSHTFQPAPGPLRAALAACSAFRATPWGEWHTKRAQGEHAHGMTRPDGKPAACPVWGCRAVEARQTA